MDSLFGRFRRIAVGSTVEIRAGPYAGRSGTVVASDAGRHTVYIDECCQPALATGELKVTGRRRGIADAMRVARDSDLEGETKRAEMEIRDWVDSQGAH